MMAVLPFAVLYGATLAALAFSILSFFRAQWLARAAELRAEGRRAEYESALDALRLELNACAGQLRDLQQQPACPAPPGGGLNLSKRSQALRLHRRGESAQQIAAALHIPQQEVDLLLKVHRVVIGSL
jgi:DNA-binding NarL/FixJ family response regulator